MQKNNNIENFVNAIGDVLEKKLDVLLSRSRDEIIKKKEEKYLNIG